VIPGVPFESDESLTPELLPKFVTALNEGLNYLQDHDDHPVKVQVWQGRLVVRGTRSGVVILVNCPKCPYAKLEAEDDV
jgi:hypothetical protein